MGALSEPLVGLEVVDEPDPEMLTRARRYVNKLLGVNRGPSEYELDQYSRVGRTPPSD